MSEARLDPDLRVRLLRRLAGFILGIGIDEIKDRQIIDRVIMSDPTAAEHDIRAKGRAWLLIALA